MRVLLQLLPRFRPAVARCRAQARHTRSYAYEFVGDAQRMHEVRVDRAGRLTIRRVDPRTGQPLKG